MFWIIGRGTYGLNLIRCLKYQSSDGIGLITTDPNDIAKWSRYLIKIHYLEPPPENKNYSDEVIKIIKDDDFITVGEEVFYIDKQSKYSSDKELLKRLHHKYVFYNFFPEYSHSIPKTHAVANLRLNDIKEKECVIKPVYGRGMINSIFRKNNVNLDKNGNQLSPLYYLSGEWVVQEHLGEFTPDNHFSSFSYSLKGKVLSHIVYSCVKTMYGFSYHRKIIDLPEIDTMVYKLIDKIGYTGFIGVDFIKKDNNYYILEVNPRITNGISFYDTFYLDTPSTPAHNETISIGPYLTNHKDLNIIKLKNDIFRWSDPLPMIYGLCNLIKIRYVCWVFSRDYQKTIENTVMSSIVKYD